VVGGIFLRNIADDASVHTSNKDRLEHSSIERDDQPYDKTPGVSDVNGELQNVFSDTTSHSLTPHPGKLCNKRPAAFSS
jgi:hypothetical protein